jgi:hypothetical protein
MSSSNYPNGISVVDNTVISNADGNIYCNNLTVNQTLSVASLNISGALTVSGATTINNVLNIAPTASGSVNAISVSTNVNGQDLFMWLTNAYGTGSTGQTCGYKVGAYDAGQIGIIANGAAVPYSGIPANSQGIYCQDKNFYITGNQGAGSSYSTFLSITNTATGGVSIRGSKAGAGPSAGYVGEIISNALGEGSAIDLVSGTYSNITSITLTPGNWLVSMLAIFDFNSITSAALDAVTGISAQSGNSNDIISGVTGAEYGVSLQATGLGFMPISIPPTPFYLTTSTTLYAKAYADNFSGTAAAFGSITATRIP